MARGQQQHQEYLDALQRLGKDLARRAKSKCELSGASGSLISYDLEGSSVEPDLDHVVLVSAEVKGLLDGGKLPSRDELRYAEEAIWSEEPAVRRAARRLLERVDEPWAREALEQAAVMEGDLGDTE